MNHVGYYTGLVGIVILLAIGLYIMTQAVERARQETCSYRCLAATGRWPTQVEWLGREESTKRIKCECFYSEKVTP